MSETISISSIDDFLALLHGVKPEKGGQYIALCPAHDDHDPSLSITEDNGKILLKCFAGCELVNILRSLGLEAKALFLDGYFTGCTAGNTSIGKPCQPVNGAPKQSQVTVDTPDGLTLATIAKAKKLPVSFLKSLSISEVRLSGLPALRIPYLAEDGQEVSVRYRMSLSGAVRFRWQKGSHPSLYGLNRLGDIRKMGWVLVVEGESDCWTCWLNDIPALGAPGKSIWPPAWGDFLNGLDVFVWQEPEAEDFTLRVLESSPNLKFISAPAGIKDLSEAHIQGRNVPDLIEELKYEAESGQVKKARHVNESLAQAYAEARHIIEADDPIELVKDEIRRLGYGGDLKPAVIAYLAATSRLLEMRPGAMPVHLLLLGPSSAGKNYTISRVTSLLPDGAYHIIDAGSPRVLIYDDASLTHKLLVYSEADSLPTGEDNPAASAIRNLLQDHCLHYQVTVRNPKTGDYVVRKVSKPGPTVLMTTSTRSLGSQLMTRLFTLEIADTREQIGAALMTQATLETEGLKKPDDGLISFQAYLQLQAPIRVAVPYAKELAAAMAKMAAAPRIQRDFARLISLIKVVALIRHHRRKLDTKGCITATLTDYTTVRELVNDMYIESSTGATGAIRKLVEAVIEICKNQNEHERITNSKLAGQLGLGLKRVTRLAKRAMRQGWLINREQRKSYPADYFTGEPMPETDGLPILGDTATVENEAVFCSSFEDGMVDTLTPLTDSNTPTADIDLRENILGMPIARVLELWRSQGAPLIHLGPGENCLDLEKLLSRPEVHERQLQAVKQRLGMVAQ